MQEAVSLPRRIVRRLKAGVRWLQMSPVERLNSSYDQDTTRFIQSLAADANCVDVGASVGAILQEMVSACPSGQHLAFEARPEAAARLTATFPNVKVHALALSDHAGQAIFNILDENPGYSGLRTQSYPVPNAKPRQITVRMEKLDDLVPAHHDVALIKIDVEGAELLVLEGAKHTLERCKPVVIFEFGRAGRESYNLTSPIIFNFFQSCGMKVSLLADRLKGKPALTIEQFDAAGKHHFYFVAHA